MAYSRAPLRTPFSRWWKKIGCVSRAFDPQSRIRSVSSISRYELVPPPAPNTVARPTTLGACHVRLQLSMLLLPMTLRANFCATKLTSFVALRAAEQPERLRAMLVDDAAQAGGRAVERLVPRGRTQTSGLADQRLSQPTIRSRHAVTPFHTRIA